MSWTSTASSNSPFNACAFLSDEKQIQIVQDLEPLFSMEGDPQLLQEVITI